MFDAEMVMVETGRIYSERLPSLIAVNLQVEIVVARSIEFGEPKHHR
jgi:hypothetical protein